MQDTDVYEANDKTGDRVTGKYYPREAGTQLK